MEKYAEIGKILYEPKNRKLKINELYEESKSNKFKEEIKNMQIDSMLKFLFTLRAEQFVEFNFEKIADYYAYQATEEEQNLLEELNLIILDENENVKNEFLKVVNSI